MFIFHKASCWWPEKKREREGEKVRERDEESHIEIQRIAQLISSPQEAKSGLDLPRPTAGLIQ